VSSATVKNLRVPLPPRLFEALRAEAKRDGRPASVAAREAIAEWLSNRRRRSVEDDLRTYVASAAGTRDDLDEALEATTIEHLASATITTKKRRARR
jgi:hypothetical protein